MLVTGRTTSCPESQVFSLNTASVSFTQKVPPFTMGTPGSRPQSHLAVPLCSGAVHSLELGPQLPLLLIRLRAASARGTFIKTDSLGEISDWTSEESCPRTPGARFCLLRRTLKLPGMSSSISLCLTFFLSELRFHSRKINLGCFTDVFYRHTHFVLIFFLLQKTSTSVTKCLPSHPHFSYKTATATQTTFSTISLRLSDTITTLLVKTLSTFYSSTGL